MMITSRGLIQHLDFVREEGWYNPHITAISRATISKPLRYLLKSQLVNTGNTVIDFGAGRLKDSNWLNENGYTCVPYDKYHKEREINSLFNCFAYKFDVLICNYVFNVIETLSDFKSTLEIVRNIEAKNKYITIRNDVKSIKPNWWYCDHSECYYTGRSFQRFIGVEGLERFFGHHKLIKNNSEYIMIELLEDEEWKNR